MDGLTAKVFRTYNASHTFQEELKKTDADASVADKILAYNRANREVAILCNHQRAVSKGHGNQVGKLQDKILLLKYELDQVRLQLLDIDPKLKKTRPELAERDAELAEETIERCEEMINEKAEKTQAIKLEKINEKLKAEGETIQTSLPAERKANNYSLEQLEKKFETLTARIHTQQTQLIDKDENKTTSLGTSKINYIDPRITAAWCFKYKVPLDKMFSKTLRDKFKWAMDVDEDFVF